MELMQINPTIPGIAVQFTNTATLVNRTTRSRATASAPIKIRSDLNIFAYKYVYSQTGFQNLNGRDIDDWDCDCHHDWTRRIPGKGSDIGFSLIFGNYGDRTYIASGTIPTVEDFLDLRDTPGVVLNVMDVSIGSNTVENLTLVYSDDNGISFNPIIPGYLPNPTRLFGGIRYIFRVLNNNLIAFNLPCHSIFSISALLQVENAGCLRDIL